MPVGARQTLRFGPFELDSQCGQLRKNGVALKLQGQPIQILEILLEKNGELVTRDELRQRLWASDTFVDFDHSLNTAIKKLRQALGEEADKPRYVETVPKRGYRFIGPVDHGESQTEPPPVQSSGTEESIARIVTTLADEAIEASAATKKSRRRVVTFAAFALLLVAGGVIYWATKPPRMPRIVGSHPVTRTGYKKVAALVTDGKSIYFQEFRPSGLALMQVQLGSGELSEIAVTDMGVVGGGLQGISDDGSELLFAITDRITGRSDAWIQPLPRGPLRLVMKDARWPRFTSDGHGMLFLRNEDRDLYLMSFDGTEARRLGGLPHATQLSVSPEGRRVRFRVQVSNELWEADLDGSHARRIAPGYQGRIAVGSWSPNGNYFFSGAAVDRFDLWALPEPKHWWKKGTPQPIQLTFGPMSIRTPIVSKDGRQLYAVATDNLGSLSVYDRKYGRFIPYLSGIPACYVDFSRDKQWVTYVSYPDGSLWRSRVDGTQRRQLTVPPLAVINPRWSPDGKFIVFTDISGGDRRRMSHAENHKIYLVSAEGGEPLLLLGGDVSDPTWSADGKSIAYGYHTKAGWEIRILDLQSQTSTTVPGSQGIWSARWSPDGKHLAAFEGEVISKLMLYSFGTQQWEVLAPGGDFGWPSWSHDSKFVYAMDASTMSYDRVAISNHKREQVASLMGVRTTGYFYDNWFGLTPDDRPVTTLSTGIEEIYAFDLEDK